MSSDRRIVTTDRQRRACTGHRAAGNPPRYLTGRTPHKLTAQINPITNTIETALQNTSLFSYSPLEFNGLIVCVFYSLTQMNRKLCISKENISMKVKHR